MLPLHLLASSLGFAAALNPARRADTPLAHLDSLPGLCDGATCACAQLSAMFGDLLLLKNSSGFTSQAEDFYDIRAVLEPKCIFVPQSAAQVAAGMSVLAACGAQFAIRGGGHMNVRILPN